ncbi:MAG TPA: undecaprenyl-diphosphatase UppP [Dehalococcoidia bacterium]|nr:undecaprenyl-diphosphatase UppP [Dehalococcoidia bacterium]
MTELLQALVLGIVQGLTEFLPISSTGHLILAEELLGIPEGKFGLPFDASIHLGTLTAVLIYFRETILRVIAAWFVSLRTRNWQETPQSRLAWLLLLGTIPAVVAGILIEDAASDELRDPVVVAAMMIIFCIPMIAAERWGRGSREVDDVNPKDALLVGAAQSVALIPGVSRSGMTISAGMLLGLRREEAASFAFLLSAPVIAGAGGKQVFDALRDGNEAAGGLDVYLVGLVSAGVVGYLAVAFLLRYLRTNTLMPFVIYRVVLGVVVLGLVAAGVL